MWTSSEAAAAITDFRPSCSEPKKFEDYAFKEMYDGGGCYLQEIWVICDVTKDMTSVVLSFKVLLAYAYCLWEVIQLDYK
jgi:hypothetical protein